MRKILLTSFTLCGAFLLGSAAQAQQAPAAPAPVPEQMPFDIPYGLPIGIEHAQKVAAAAAAEAAKHHWKLAISVVDPNGDLIYFWKMDGTQNASVKISQHKASAAATYRRPTKVFQDGIDGGHPYLITLDGIVGSQGGFPLVENGKLIGAIGCSGATGEQDAAACKMGADTVK